MTTISQLCLIFIFPILIGAQTQSPTVTPVSGDVRLAGGSDTAGRVEVYWGGEWGTVCDNGWGIEDANIVCNQLGFPRALSAPSGAAFGEGSGPVHYDYVGCFGGEPDLKSCSRSALPISCNHSQDASVSCFEEESTVAPVSGDVRLAGGSDTVGRVEVYWGGEWGTVCDNGWGIEDANIVCNQLGFPRALLAPSGAAFGEGSGPVHYDYVGCFGGEPDLKSCSRSALPISCNHSQDASVVCLEEESPVTPGVPVDGNVRLVGGNDTAGRVEVYIGGVWGTVCDDRWNTFDGHVVCRQLGFRGAVEARDVSFGPGVDPIHLSELECLGNEPNLLECPHALPDQVCDHSDDAGVVCLPPGSSEGVLGEIRLAGLTATAGRVEVYDKGEWGTVCDNGWDIEDANIVCNFLGFPRAVSALPGAVFGEGSGPVHYDNVGCFGGEPDLYRCSRNATVSCQHDQDASVVCLEEESTVTPGSTAQSLPPPTCEPLVSSFCGGMPYNQTEFPNVAGYTTQEEAEGMLSLVFEPVIPLGCPPDFFQFMCLQFMPPCDSTGVPTIPCKELCETGLKECITIVEASGVSIPLDLDCSVLPAEESGVCFTGDSTRYPYEMGGTAQPQSLPPPTCEPLQSSSCRGMPYNLTVFPNAVGFTTQEEAEGILSVTFEPVIPLGCQAGFFQFMCLQFMPPCDSIGVPTIPCKELCETGLKECITIMEASGIPVPLDLDCSLFPAEATGVCFVGDPSRYPYEMGLHCTPACGANETCSDVGGPPNSCVCAEGYTTVDGVCQVKTCANINCGVQGICVGNDTVFYNCECNLHFSFKEGDICVDKTCGNSKVCSGPGDSCEDHYISYMCFCGENRTHNEDQSNCVGKNCENSNVCSGPGDSCMDHHNGFMCSCGENRTLNEDQSDCVAKTCDNSCNGEGEDCTMVNGYSCTCQEGYTRPSEDWPCTKNALPTITGETLLPTKTPMMTETRMPTEAAMVTETLMPTEILMTSETLLTTETLMPTEILMTSETLLTTETPVPTQSTMPPEPPMTTEPGETTKREKTSESTKPSESTKSPSTPDAKNAAGGHKYTGAIVGLFIFLVATCLVFVAVYLVRRKLRNNYGRLDEDTEGDSGWSAFSKNPIYRGDRDYQLL